MPEYLIPTLLLQMFIVGYTPGPPNIIAFSTAVRFGKREALKVWVGLLTGFCIAAAITATLTHFLGIALGEYVVWLKYLGGAYIMYLAFRALKMGISTGTKDSCTFWDGVVVQLTNAKTLLFEISVYGSFVLPYSSKLSDLYIVAAWLLIEGPLGNLLWIFLGSKLKRFFESNMKTVDIITAVALAGCSLYIIFM